MAATSQKKTLFEDYDGFVEKFKPKKTTDDCYTPANVYDVVADYVAERYGIHREKMVRPFWPGADFEAYDYPADCCVVDNPPFSIITRIVREYMRRGICFFLFCPYLTGGQCASFPGTTLIVAPQSIRYENGAEVNTCFVTSLEPENALRGDPDLLDRLKAADDENRKKITKQLPKYDYPDEVLTVTKVGWFTVHHTPYALRREDCVMISRMDAQKLIKKSIFGNGYLLSERAAAERAAAHKWQLSDRERQLQKMIGSPANG